MHSDESLFSTTNWQVVVESLNAMKCNVMSQLFRAKSTESHHVWMDLNHDHRSRPFPGAHCIISFLFRDN